MGYALLKRKKIDAEQQVNIGPAYKLRQSSEISAEALSNPFSNSGTALAASRLELPAFYFLQNCHWYIRGHWKQALVAAGAYAVTIFIWTRLI